MNIARANLFLAGAAAVLAIPTILTLRADAALFKAIEDVPRLFPGFTDENVGAVVIGIPKASPEAGKQSPSAPNQPKPPVQYDSLKFVRNEKGWILGSGDLMGAPVQQGRVEKVLLDHLRGVRYDKETLVAENASDEDLARYGLDEEHAMVIKAGDKSGTSVVAEMLVGKDANAGNADNVRGYYVRRKDSKDVVLYEGQFYKPGVKPEEWVDRTIHRIEAGKVQKFSYQGPATGGRPVTFERQNGAPATWIASEAPEGVGAVRQQEVETMVQRFCWLSAQDFRGPLERANLGEIGLEPARFTISATVADDSGEKTHTVVIGNKVDDKNEFYVKGSDSVFLMTLAQYMVTPFERDPKELFDPPAPASGAGGESAGGTVPDKPPADKPANDKPPADQPKKQGP
ncbi:MAG: hypothetical protein Fur0037_07860 [Planctomycetota bacterium]